MSALAGIRGRVFAVLGNHDGGKRTSAIRRAMDAHGYTLLRDEVAHADVTGDRVLVIGLDGSHRNHLLQEELLSKISTDHAAIALSLTILHGFG